MEGGRKHCLYIGNVLLLSNDNVDSAISTSDHSFIVWVHPDILAPAAQKPARGSISCTAVVVLKLEARPGVRKPIGLWGRSTVLRDPAGAQRPTGMCSRELPQ